MLDSLNFPSLPYSLPFWGIAPLAKPENRSAATQRKASSTNISVNKTKTKMNPEVTDVISVSKKPNLVCHVCHGTFRSMVDFTIHMELRHGI